jgi:hypothetical protein
MWLRDFLTEDNQFRGARIFTFGYNADTAFTTSIAEILDIANDLLSEVTRVMNVGETRVVMHGMQIMTCG